MAEEVKKLVCGRQTNTKEKQKREREGGRMR